MMVMPSNWAQLIVGYWAGRYPGSVGHLYSPGGLRKRPEQWLPFALDNGAWPAHLNDRAWDEGAWRHHLRTVALGGETPLWVVVPDVVGNRTATLERWPVYVDEVKGYGWPPAFAAQDGMAPSDVPDDAEVVFLGGSTDWKLGALARWGRAFPGRLHVARVNTYKRLVLCYQAGAISCDGTGWGRGSQQQLAGLKRFIEEVWNREN